MEGAGIMAAKLYEAMTGSQLRDSADGSGPQMLKQSNLCPIVRVIVIRQHSAVPSILIQSRNLRTGTCLLWTTCGSEDFPD